MAAQRGLSRSRELEHAYREKQRDILEELLFEEEQYHNWDVRVRFIEENELYRGAERWTAPYGQRKRSDDRVRELIVFAKDMGLDNNGLVRCIEAELPYRGSKD